MSVFILQSPPGTSDALKHVTRADVVARIQGEDHTLWSSTPDEIVNRLGWLHLPLEMSSQVPRIGAFADALHNDGFKRVIVLGMGGSSLAPDMLSRIFTIRDKPLHVEVLDSTHPESVERVARETGSGDTLFLVATKSGTTSETLSLFRYFYRFVIAKGTADPGRCFAAITDPGTPLADQALRLGFQETFLNPPNIGGRYSALSLFGLVPARLLNIDLDVWLRNAKTMAMACSPRVTPTDNPAVQLGCYLGAAALAGRDKATLLLSRTIAPFGDWIEQLVAESSGKDGMGILPVLEPLHAMGSHYSDDRAFVLIGPGDDPELMTAAEALQHAGHPVAQLDVPDVMHLSAQFYLWEMATAVACHLLGVHPFNQPNVESAKRMAREAAEAARHTGKTPSVEDRALTPVAVATDLETLSAGDYVGIHAYLPATDELTGALTRLQSAVRDRFGVAVTIGYGPRFLHSTGQLHKGDAGRGRFIQLVSRAMPHVPIPDEPDDDASSLSFAGLITSQAAGDRRALEAVGRRVSTFSLPSPAVNVVHEIAQGL